jgi:hypothetical protein
LRGIIIVDSNILSSAGHHGGDAATLGHDHSLGCIAAVLGGNHVLLVNALLEVSSELLVVLLHDGGLRSVDHFSAVVHDLRVITELLVHESLFDLGSDAGILGIEIALVVVKSVILVVPLGDGVVVVVVAEVSVSATSVSSPRSTASIRGAASVRGTASVVGRASVTAIIATSSSAEATAGSESVSTPWLAGTVARESSVRTASSIASVAVRLDDTLTSTVLLDLGELRLGGHD